MSFGLNNWNNHQQVRDQMENESLEYQMRETNPDQAKKDLASRMSVRGAILILLVIVLAVLLFRGM
jgi:hypothetical protein